MTDTAYDFSKYPDLQRLANEEMGPELPLHVQKRYLAAGVHAASLPPGEARDSLLTTLSSGLRAQVERWRLSAKCELMRKQLEAERPEASRVNEMASVLRRSFKTVRGNFTKACDLERAQGRNPAVGAWFWFEHELVVQEHIMNDLLTKAENGVKLW